MTGARHEVVEQDMRRIVSAPLPWEDLRGKTVLITGAAGFLPAYMAETLLFLNEIDPTFGVHVVVAATGCAASRRQRLDAVRVPGVVFNRLAHKRPVPTHVGSSGILQGSP